MKILFITDDDPISSWIVTELAKQFNCPDMIQVNWDSRRTLIQKLVRALKKPGTTLSNLYLAPRISLWGKNREKLAESKLWQATQASQSRESLNIIEMSGRAFNNEANEAQIRQLQPDLMIVCGGPILRKPIFSIPRLGTVNIHFGISPFYRGQHTILWPLMKCDFGHIGATIHQIDSGVDTGEVFARLYPEIEPGDNDISLEIKIAKLVHATTTELIQFIESQPELTSLSGVKFTEKGQQIYSRDLTPWVDLKYLFHRFLGKAKVPHLPERRELFYTNC